MKRMFQRLFLLLSIIYYPLFGVQLNFQNPQLESGIALQKDAVYRFKDVADGVDALVKITGFSGGAMLADIDETDTGLQEAFQPVLQTSFLNSDSSVDFEITFVTSGTDTPHAITFDATGADIDGDGGSAKEYIELSTPAAYSLEQETRLEVQQSDTGLYIEPQNADNVSGITVTETRNTVTATYRNTYRFRYRIGAKNGKGQRRYNSLYFDEVPYTQEQTNTIPVVTIDDVTDFEGDEGNKTFSFTVHFSEPVSEGAGFWVTFTDGPADESNTGAYLASSHTGDGFDPSERDLDGEAHYIELPAGVTEYQIDVSVLGDLFVENDEIFYVDIYAMDQLVFPDDSDRVLTDSDGSSYLRATGTILNDDVLPVAEYRMDACFWTDAEGNVTDTQGRYHATAKEGAMTTYRGKIKRAGRFNGHSYIDAGERFDEVFGTGSDQFTITAWISPSVLTDAQTNHYTKNTFIAKASDPKNDNLEIGVNPDGSLHVYLDTRYRDKYADFGTGITENSWHFVAVKYYQGEVSVTIDGTVYKDDQTWKDAKWIDQAVGSPLTIGASLHVDNFFQGLVDEVKIYDKAISDEKIQAIYHAEKENTGEDRKSGVCLIGEYRFDACEWFAPAGKVKDNIEGFDGMPHLVQPTSDAIRESALLVEDPDASVEAEMEYSFQDPFSMTFWMKLDRMPQKSYMAVLNKEFELYVGKNGKLYLNPKNGMSDLVVDENIEPGIWYFITITSDGDTLLFYVDGVQKGSISAEGLGENGDSRLILGQTLWSLGSDIDVEPFAGTLDEMKIFDQAISVEEMIHIISIDAQGINYDGTLRQQLRCLEPVGCTSKAIIIDDTKYVHQVDLVTGDKNTTVMNEEQVNDAAVNGFGYNVKDGFLWGSYNPGKGGYLVKIGKDENGEFAQTKVGPVEGLPVNKGTYIGDINNDGFLYLYYKNTPESGVHTMYIIDLNKNSEDYLKVVDSFTLRNLNIADMAFNPIDKQLYAIETYRDLYKIDVQTHTATKIKSQAVDGTNEVFGSSFFDAQGFFYAIKNTSRKIYRIDISDPQRIRSLIFSTLENEDVQKVNIDGGRCNLKPIYIDYGDAPDSSSYSEGDGTGAMNYKTLTSDDGPRHSLPDDENATNVYLGVTVNAESDAKSSQTEYNYDLDDGIVNGIKPVYTNMFTYSLDVRVTNDKNVSANLTGWIDFNRNGRFEQQEATALVIAANTQNVYTLVWNVPDDVSVGTTYARFRVTTDPMGTDEVDSYGPKSDGEVEDWELTIREGSLYDVWDPESDVTHRTITTKLVNTPFTLTVASVSRAGLLKESTGSHIKVRLVSKQDGTVLSDYQDVNLSGLTQKNVVFEAIPAVSREVQAQIQFVDESNVTREINATDLFAIRPDHFEIYANENAFVAGKDFNITLLAKDANGTTVGTFTESAQSYLLDIDEVKTTVECQEINVTVTKKIARDFSNGESNITIQYPDIGNLRFKVYENIGSEYALIDSGDTDDNQRLIRPDEKSYGMSANRIEVDWVLRNGDMINEVTYYNSYDALDSDYNTMYARFDLKVSVKNALNEPVKKFTEGCYAEDVNIAITYQLDSNDTFGDYQVLASYEDRNGTFYDAVSKFPQTFSRGEHTISQFTLDKSFFENGTGIKNVKFNFQRDASLPMNPLRLTFREVNATVDSLSAQEDNAQSLKFFYVRAYIPDQSVVGVEMSAKVYYEVYCKSCDMSGFGLVGLPESVDNIYWYQLGSVNESQYFDFSDPAISNQLSPSGAISAISGIFKSIEKRDAGKMLYTEINKAPQTVRIKYEPKKYLLFNPFNPAVTMHSFTAKFVPEGKSWAGKGDLGYTVDTSIAPRDSINIIDW